MSEFHSLIDRASFGTVRSYLNRPGSPITDVIFVEDHELMCEVAEALTSPVSPLRRNRLMRWFEAGRVSVGTTVPKNETVPSSVRLQDVFAIDRDALCDVLYLPPYYLVHLAADRLTSFASSLG